MGEFNFEGDISLKERKHIGNTLLNKCDGLKILCILFHNTIVKMGEVENKGMDNSNLILELELRIVCNILINFCFYNNHDSNVVQDFTHSDLLIEETCLMAIKLSLDTSFVPVRKIILVFYIYIRYLFGEKKEDSSHK